MWSTYEKLWFIDTMQKVKGIINLFGQSSFWKTNKCRLLKECIWPWRLHIPLNFNNGKCFELCNSHIENRVFVFVLEIKNNFKQILKIFCTITNKQTNRTKTYFLARVIDKNISATLVFTSVGLTDLLSKLSTVLIVWPWELAYNIPDLPCIVL